MSEKGGIGLLPEGSEMSSSDRGRIRRCGSLAATWTCIVLTIAICVVSFLVGAAVMGGIAASGVFRSPILATDVGSGPCVIAASFAPNSTASSLEMQLVPSLPNVWSTRDLYRRAFERTMNSIESDPTLGTMWQFSKSALKESIVSQNMWKAQTNLMQEPHTRLRFRRIIQGRKIGENDMSLKLGELFREMVEFAPVESSAAYARSSSTKLEANYYWQPLSKPAVAWQRSTAIDNPLAISTNFTFPNFQLVRDAAVYYPRVAEVFGWGVTLDTPLVTLPSYCLWEGEYKCTIRGQEVKCALYLEYPDCDAAMTQSVAPRGASFEFKWRQLPFLPVDLHSIDLIMQSAANKTLSMI